MKSTFLVVLLAVGVCFARPVFESPSYWRQLDKLEGEVENTALVSEGEDEEVPTEGNAAGEAAEESTVTSESPNKAEWVFSGDWEEKVEGQLTAGDEVKILYDASRLPGRDTMYGDRAWDIFVEYKFNGGEVHSEKLDGPDPEVHDMELMTKTISLPFGTTTLTVWFKHWGYYSGNSYDSNLGSNYEEAVSTPEEATIVFDNAGGETGYGELEKGEEFDVYYAAERLGKGSAVSAVVKYSDDGELDTHTLTASENGYLTTTYNIPDGAEKVIMWFYTGEGEERKYDSNYGQNYEFSVKTE